jgi:hypothetical protein
MFDFKKINWKYTYRIEFWWYKRVCQQIPTKNDRKIGASEQTHGLISRNLDSSRGNWKISWDRAPLTITIL